MQYSCNYIVLHILIFAKTLLPFQLLLDISIVLVVAILLILLFIVFYLFFHLNKASKTRHLVRMYEDFISEVILCDSNEELEELVTKPYIKKIAAHCLSKPLGRKVLIQELVKISKNISGKGTENLRWLYEYFQLKDDSIKDFSSSKWHRKANAIQQLAQMGQIKHLTRIYKATNSKNKWIRAEAQIAIVKMTGSEGLRFLNIISHPLNQWQQLCLLRELSVNNEFDNNKLKGWLLSTNDSVIEFTLRLIKKFGCYDLHDEVLNCLFHPSLIVKVAALSTLAEIAREETAYLFHQKFNSTEKNGKFFQLSPLKSLCTNDQVAFLESLLVYETATTNNFDKEPIMKVAQGEIKVYNLPINNAKKIGVA